MNAKAIKQYAVKQLPEEREMLDKKWDIMNSKLKKQNSDYVEPNIPFKPNNLIRDFNFLYEKIYDKEKFIAA